MTWHWTLSTWKNESHMNSKSAITLNPACNYYTCMSSQRTFIRHRSRQSDTGIHSIPNCSFRTKVIRSKIPKECGFQFCRLHGISWHLPSDLVLRLLEEGRITKMPHNLVTELRNLPLQCHRCSAKPRTLVDLKLHLMTHLKWLWNTMTYSTEFILKQFYACNTTRWWLNNVGCDFFRFGRNHSKISLIHFENRKKI